MGNMVHSGIKLLFCLGWRNVTEGFEDAAVIEPVASIAPRLAKTTVRRSFGHVGFSELGSVILTVAMRARPEAQLPSTGYDDYLGAFT